jgi:hypothetical protein
LIRDLFHEKARQCRAFSLQKATLDAAVNPRTDPADISISFLFRPLLERD